MIKITNNYSKIIEYNTNIDKIFTKLYVTSKYLRETYEELMRENTTIDSLTTDSFAFQNNIFIMRIANFSSIYNKIVDQIYSDYYKLLRYIINYIESSKKTIENINQIEILNNLLKSIEQIEPYRLTQPASNNIYNIENSREIYDIIINILITLNSIYEKQETLIKTRITRFNSGLHIENYLDNIRHNNKVLLKNIDLISHFLSGYEKYHIKYLSTLETELDSLYCKLTQDIDINNTSKNKTISIKAYKSSSKMYLKRVVYLLKYLKCEYINEVVKNLKMYKVVIKLNIVLMCVYMMYMMYNKKI